MKNRVTTLTSLFLISLFPVVGFAKEKKPPTPCDQDIDRFCKKAKGGEEGVNKCLQAQGPNLSVGCKASIDEMAEFKALQQKVTDLRKTCKTDIETLCPSVTPGGGRQLKCLRVQAEKLTTPCRDLLASSGVMDLPLAPAATTGSTGTDAGQATGTTTTPAGTTPATKAPETTAPKKY